MAVHVIASVIVEDGKLLVVKEFNENEYHTPGGTVKKNETPEETLKRELKEEIGVRLLSMSPFGKFDSKTFDGDDLLLETYFAEIQGKIKPCSEIEKFSWVGKDYKNNKIKLTIPLERYILPKLIEGNLIK